MSFLDDLKTSLGLLPSQIVEDFADWQPGLNPEAIDFQALRGQISVTGIPLLDEIAEAHLGSADAEQRPGVWAPDLRPRLEAMEDDQVCELAVASMERAAVICHHGGEPLGYPSRVASELCKNYIIAAGCAIETRPNCDPAMFSRLAKSCAHTFSNEENLSSLYHICEKFCAFFSLVAEAGPGTLDHIAEASLEGLSTSIDKYEHWSDHARDCAISAQSHLLRALRRPESDSSLMDEEAEAKAGLEGLMARVEGCAGSLLWRFMTHEIDQPGLARKYDVTTNPVFSEITASTPEQRGGLLARLWRTNCLMQEIRRGLDTALSRSAFRDQKTLRTKDLLPFERLEWRLVNLSKALLRKKLAMTDEDAAFVIGMERGLCQPDLRVLTLAETTLGRGPAPKTRAALAELMDWIVSPVGRGLCNKQYRNAALPRIKAALGTDVEEEAATNLEPPPITGVIHPSVQTVMDFYGDLADLRKTAPDHIAFLARLAEQEVPRTAETSRMENDRKLLLEVQWLRRRVEAIGALPSEFRQSWERLHKESRALAGKSKPSAKWLGNAASTLATLDAKQRVAFLELVLAATAPNPTRPLPADDAARGLIYLASTWPPEPAAALLADYAAKVCFKTVKGVGIAGERLGNACLFSLINLPDGAGVPYLARLFTRIKYPKVRKRIGKALDEAAAKAGVTRAELEELALADHGLSREGTVEIEIGEGAALIEIDGSASAVVKWRTPEGKVVKSVPAALKPFKSEIKAARALAKEIAADLASQIVRLQRIYLEKRSWPSAVWRKRYAEHPLQGGLVGRLIWNLHRAGERVSGIWVDHGLRDVTGNAMPIEDAEITLWHPIDSSNDEVLGWRRRLSELEIVQPFKQAHREVYLLSAAERETGTYSNRFAGHIVKQHQLMALARANGWNVTHRMWADVPNDEPTHLVIPAHDLVAQYWTEGAGGEDPEVTEAGAYLYLSTDQIRFYAIAETEGPDAGGAAHGPICDRLLPLEEIPPIIFSEVMRHCGLFVGVASIANDANWVDSGAEAQHPSQWRREIATPYWHGQAYGELDAMAQTRRMVLKALLPALSIADRCKLEERFLTVQGRLRKYRIHLGSAQVLIEPDNQHLCIVPDRTRSKGDKIALPWEEDDQLSIIISKAFLLAADHKISDQTILQQLRRSEPSP